MVSTQVDQVLYKGRRFISFFLRSCVITLSFIPYPYGLQPLDNAHTAYNGLFLLPKQDLLYPFNPNL